MLSPFGKAKLERKALQNRLAFDAPVPRDGWIRAVRSALGMRTVQLARRLGVRPQAIAEFERSERERRITLQSLDRIAEAMGCRVAYFFVPNEQTFETVFEKQTRKYLEYARLGVAHTMELEGQGVKRRSSIRESVEDAWTIVEGYREIWDAPRDNQRQQSVMRTQARKKTSKK